MDLEVRGRRSSPRARRRRRRPPGTPARPATRRARRSAACAAAAAFRGRAPVAPTRPRARSARAAAARRAGPAGRSPASRARRRRDPGAVPASPRQAAPAGSVACLRTPSSKSAYGRFSRSATMRETPSICASSSASTCSSSPATFATTSTVRSSCVGPRPPEVATSSAEASASRSAASSSAGLVADDLDPRRLEPEREQGAGEERPVQVGALASHELAAGDDDHRPWAACARAQLASAAKIFFAVTKTPCALTAAAGSFTRLPFSFTSTFAGASSRIQSTLPSKRCRWPRSSVPL